MKMIFIDSNIDGRAGEPPLNIALLKSFINNKTKHTAKIIDLTFNKKNWKCYVNNIIGDERYDLVGISCLSFNYTQSLQVASFIKEEYDIKIIFGGIHTILMPEQVINNKDVDYVCTGEGEYPLKELLDNNLKPEGIKSIWYKTNNGEVKKNENGEVVKNLDEMPFPDWDDFEIEKYFKINGNQLSLMASRGCPYPCTYCAAHALKKKLNGKWVRFRSVDNFMDEVELRIKQFKDKGLELFKFNDDIFILDKKFLFEFCKRYKEKGFHRTVPWTTTVRANLVTDEIINAMKSAGCVEIGMGIESVDDYVRNKVYKRKMTMNQIENAVGILKKYKMQLHIPIIIGSPYDTMEILEKNLKFMKKLKPEVMLLPVLMPLPGTEIRELCEKEGLIEEFDFKRSIDMSTKPVARTKYVTREQVQKFVKKARLYQAKRYFIEGIKMGKLMFFWDLIRFFLYYKTKYDLEVDNVFKFTIYKYHMKEKIKNIRYL